MMYPYCKYADRTEVVFSHIIKDENGNEIIYVHIEMFRTVVERGMPSSFRWANQGGILIK